MEDIAQRSAKYKCVVTCMDSSVVCFQIYGQSFGKISNEIIILITKNYFYSGLILEEIGKILNSVPKVKLSNTYRYEALEKALKKIKFDNSLKNGIIINGDEL